MKNRQKGFVTPLTILIVLLLVMSVAYVNKNPLNFSNVNIPNTANNISTPVATTTNNDLWLIFDKSNEALKNKDIAAYNAVSYKQVTPDQIPLFTAMATSLYNESMKLNKADFVNKWQDDKQAIYSTNPVKDDTATSYGYKTSQIMFIKTNNSWKVLMMELGSQSLPKTWENTTAKIEQDLQAMMLDSDKDGLTDRDELCEDAQMGNPDCVKTDPRKRDTNGNGWWDGIEENMK